MRDTVIYIRANGHYQVLKKVRMTHAVIYESLNMVKFMTGKECVKNISIHYPYIILFRVSSDLFLLTFTRCSTLTVTVICTTKAKIR